LLLGVASPEKLVCFWKVVAGWVVRGLGWSWR
jgi:hypothetical protein